MDGSDFGAPVAKEQNSPKNVVSDWSGSKYLMSHCCDKAAQSSYDEAMKHVQSKKQRSIENSFRTMYDRFVNNLRISRDSLAKEAALKGTGGVTGGKDLHFYAFRKFPIRSYFWYSPSAEGKVWISHYKFKNQQKLDPADTKRVRENFREIEGA
jgi:hypothetical protein